MPDLDDILAVLCLVCVPLGVGLVAGSFLGVLAGVGAALVALGVLALAGFLLLVRATPTAKAAP